MKVAVIGGGGREHAIIKALKNSASVTELYCIPGNGGISRDAVCVDIPATDVGRITNWCADNDIDLVAVIPDDPLALGMVDSLNAAGIRAFGPDKKAAVIEASKAFAKDLMKKYGIPTADYRIFEDSVEAKAFIEQNTTYPIVVKADGLALGKGVIIAADKKEAVDAISGIMDDRVFGESGSKIVIEEFLTGPEVSVLAFTDGKTIVPMVSSMDHKRAGDGDTGLNTGGMGTVAPNPFYTAEVADICMKEIFVPTVEAMNAEGRTFRGVLYFGLMLTPKGPKVIEYNCRFGDPETQVVLPLLKTDLLTIMLAVIEGRLSEVEVVFSDESACCVVAASGGYPVKYEKGKPVTISEMPSGVTVFHAGTKLDDNGRLVTSGGRVLGVTAVADDLSAARDLAYASVKNVHFDGMFYRSDIGARALSALG